LYPERYQLSAISYQLSAISYQLSAISYQLSAISYQLSAISYHHKFKFFSFHFSLFISRLTADDSRFLTHYSQFTAHCSLLTTHYFRQLHNYAGPAFCMDLDLTQKEIMRSTLLSCFIFMMLVFFTHNKIIAQHVGIGTITPLQTLDVNGGLRIGETSTASTGSIRWNETKSDFEGYNGVAWVSLTGGKGKWGDQATFSTENEASQISLVYGDKPGTLLGWDIEGNGDWIVAGAFRDADPYNEHHWDAGSIRVFHRTTDTWDQPLTAYDPDATTNDFFGFSVGMTSTHVIAGAYQADMPNVNDQGKAYVYAYNSNQLTLQTVLLASDAQASDHFGSAVSIYGDYAVVGAPHNDVLGYEGMGRAYVFTRNGTIWTQTLLLSPGDGTHYDSFGGTVKLWGDYMAIASPSKTINGYVGAGKVYVYKRNGNNWSLIQQIISPVPKANESFGSALEMNDNKLFIGAPDNAIASSDSCGLVHIYQINNNSVTYDTTISPSGGKVMDGFGSSIDFLNNTLLVGAHTSTLGAIPEQGKAYVYTYGNNQWTEEAKLKSSTNERGMYFGKAVALVPGYAIVAAPLADTWSWPDHGQLFFFKQY
jgi:hypothetical protein